MSHKGAEFWTLEDLKQKDRGTLYRNSEVEWPRSREISGDREIYRTMYELRWVQRAT
jgi:hypothetical protein